MAFWFLTEKSQNIYNIKLVCLTLDAFRLDLHRPGHHSSHCFISPRGPHHLSFPSCHVVSQTQLSGLYIFSSFCNGRTTPPDFLLYFHLNRYQYLKLHILFGCSYFLLFVPQLEQKLLEGWDFVLFTRVFTALKMMSGMGRYQKAVYPLICCRL